MEKKVLRKPSTNDQPSQAFRSSALEEPVYIPTRLDHTEKTERHVILWEDIQQVFKDAQHIMNGSTMVPFVIDRHFKRVVPWRIQYRRGAVLDVILDNPAVAQGSGMNSKSPKLSAYPDTSISAKDEPRPFVAPLADNEKSIQAGDETCFDMQKSQAVPHKPSPHTDREQNSEIGTKSNPALNASDQALEMDTDDDTCSLPELEMLTIADTVLTEASSSATTSNKPTATPLVQDNEDLPEQHRSEKEYEAMLYMMLILESSSCNIKDFAAGDIMRALSILSHSDSIDSQRMAADAFLEIAKAKEHVVTPETLGPLLLLLQSDDTDTLRDALEAVISLTRNDSSNGNKLLIIKLGGLKHIIRALSSVDSEILLNATGCMMNLAVIEKNREIMMVSGSIPPLIRLAQESELEVRQKAVKALSNLAASQENKKELGNTHAIATLISLLDSPDPELQSLAAGAINNIISHDDGNDMFSKSATELITPLTRLLDSVHEEVRRNAVRALGNIAKNGAHTGAIICEGSLGPLLRILQSDQDSDVQVALDCLVKVSAVPSNKVAVVKAGFIGRLANLIDSSKDKSILETSAATLCFLVMDGDQSTILSLYNEGVMSYNKICDTKNVLCTLIALLDSPDTEVPYMSAMMIHALSEQKQSGLPYIPLATSVVDAANMRPFMDVWDTPFDGLRSKTCLRDALIRILKGTNATLQQLAMETICELLEGRSIEMIRIITQCSPIVNAVVHLAKAPVKTHPKKSSKKRAAKKSNVTAKDQEDEKGQLATRASMLLDIIMFCKEGVAQVQ
ncbi:Vacuolar protein 8 [Mortierella polycephala]|uniref:Vacuolar protein 8 n=1 Tax=Mortierella polycephala TaxID=41804 RepID=A0A9P6PKE7_9FUNG|nr:Vacuolar protein 8 [Mortierella polycephala]